MAGARWSLAVLVAGGLHIAAFLGLADIVQPPQLLEAPVETMEIDFVIERPPEPEPEPVPPEPEPLPEPPPPPEPELIPEPDPLPEPPPEPEPEPEPIPEPTPEPPPEPKPEPPPPPKPKPKPEPKPVVQKIVPKPTPKAPPKPAPPSVAVGAKLERSYKPSYPSTAKRANLEGRVLLDIVVETNGKVGIVRLATSSGHSSLDQSAIKSVKRWRFKAAKTSTGLPIAQKIRVPIDFRLR